MPEGVTVPEWVRGENGFVIQKREPLSDEEKLKRFVEGSQDFVRAVRLARACGTKGRDLLVALLLRWCAPQAAADRK